MQLSAWPEPDRVVVLRFWRERSDAGVEWRSKVIVSEIGGEGPVGEYSANGVQAACEIVLSLFEQVGR